MLPLKRKVRDIIGPESNIAHSQSRTSDPSIVVTYSGDIFSLIFRRLD